MSQTRERSQSFAFGLNAFGIAAGLGVAALHLSNEEIGRACGFLLAAIFAGTLIALQHFGTTRAGTRPGVEVFWTRWGRVLQSLLTVAFISAATIPDLATHQGALQFREWFVVGLLALAAAGPAILLTSTLRQRLA